MKTPSPRNVMRDVLQIREPKNIREEKKSNENLYVQCLVGNRFVTFKGLWLNVDRRSTWG